MQFGCWIRALHQCWIRALHQCWIRALHWAGGTSCRFYIFGDGRSCMVLQPGATMMPQQLVHGSAQPPQGWAETKGQLPPTPSYVLSACSSR